MIRADVIIIGGGPAGSAAAWQLQQQGADCIVLDQAPFPRFKPCAGWIQPSVAGALGMAASYPHGFITFRRLAVTINRFHARVPTHQHAIRRYEFDNWLLQRSGAPVHCHTVKTIMPQPDGYSIDGQFFGQYLIGAGGTYCPVYRALFKADTPRAREDLIAAQEEEFPWEQPSRDCWLWFWDGLPGYAWFVPKANGYVNVGVGAWAEALKAGGTTLKTHWERLIAEVQARGLVGERAWEPAAHSYYLRQRLPRIRRDNAFLVGDSAGLATVDMGEGIGPAIQSGLRAADAILTGGEYRLDGIEAYSQGRLLGEAVKALYRRNGKKGQRG